MDLTLDEEYAALRETVADFARTAVAPVIGDLYERGAFPYDLVRRMGAMGLFGLPLAEERRIDGQPGHRVDDRLPRL
jgi:alkylation response protein AidB-like acyl-CoA dehydrogenase